MTRITAPTATWRTWRQDDATWKQQFVPLTGVEAIYAWESGNGRYQFGLRGRWGQAVTPGTDTEWAWETLWQAEARAEIILLSINDQPLSIPLRFELDKRGDTALDWRAFAGLRISFQTGS